VYYLALWVPLVLVLEATVPDAACFSPAPAGGHESNPIARVQ